MLVEERTRQIRVTFRRNTERPDVLATRVITNVQRFDPEEPNSEPTTAINSYESAKALN